jgi:creatinine amidohydrolase
MKTTMGPFRILLAAPLLWIAASSVAAAAAERYALQWATYLDGSDYEHAREVCTDPQGNVYVVGGTVLPTFFYGTGGGHIGYKWTLMLPEAQVAPLIEATLDHLARQGFKVVVLLTGHYPQEQVDMVHRLAAEAQKRHPRVRFIGLTEPEITTPQPGDSYGGDHAAKYETSIALALNPDWVRLGQLTAGRDPNRVTLPDTPRNKASTHDPAHPLYAIHGQDPREKASKELGAKLVGEIVSRLADRVIEALGQTAKPPSP